MKKHISKDLFDRYACALCGDEDIYSGLIFKGHFVCEDCVEYVSSGTVTDDGKIVFPDGKAEEDTHGESGSVPESPEK